MQDLYTYIYIYRAQVLKVYMPMYLHICRCIYIYMKRYVYVYMCLDMGQGKIRAFHRWICHLLKLIGSELNAT